MASPVMLRWSVPVRPPHTSSRAAIKSEIAPIVRGSGWLSSPGSTHYLSDQVDQIWLTVVAALDDVSEIREELESALGFPPQIEVRDGPLLTEAADAYRAALQTITHVGLDIIDAAEELPISEYEAFETPSDAAPILVEFLARVSETYRRVCSEYESTERFWVDFFRPGPTPELSRAGRWLWNLAG